MLEILLAFPVGLYVVAIARRLISWLKLPVLNVPKAFQPKAFISVIVPVRNEEASIFQLLQDLEKQNYPAHLFEVIVIDDHSTDNTVALAQDFGQIPGFCLKIEKLQDREGLQHKKAAVNLGVEKSEGELLLFTDGDCRVQPHWLRNFAYLYETKGAKLISGAVCLRPARSFFEKLQLVEFSSLIGVGAASLAMGRPNMCNGANLAYAKEAFLAAEGFKGNEHIASGDDEFMLHKLHTLYPDKLFFLKSAETIVYTAPQRSLKSFIAQRVRWASKWRQYQSKFAKQLAVLVFSANAALVIIFALALAEKLSWSYFLVLYIAKFAVDVAILLPVLKFLGKAWYIFYSLPLQLVYIPYVIYTALKGLKGTYNWKGRNIKSH